MEEIARQDQLSIQEALSAPIVAEKKKAAAKQKAPPKVTPQQVQKVQELVEEIKEEEEDVVRRQLVRKINMYIDALGHKLQHKPRKATTKEDVKALKDKLFTIEADLALGSGLDLADRVYIDGMWGIEQFTMRVYNPLELNLRGLRQVTEDSRDVWGDLVTEFAIKHSEWFAASVETRLLMMTARMIITVHQANVVGSATVPASETVKNKAQGL